MIFFVGASRTGSTWLARAFTAHPDVIQPIKKPVRFWNLKVFGGCDPKSSHPTLTLDEYMSLFTPERGKLKADLTDGYHILCPTVITHIKNYFPEAKIIFLMRDPFDIVQSHFQLHRAASAVDRERVDQQLGSVTGYSYQNIRQIDAYTRWSEVFGRENVWVGFYEDFFADASSNFGEICKYLGIRSVDLPEKLNSRVNQRRHEDKFNDEVSDYIRELCEEQMSQYAKFRANFDGPGSLEKS
jgi:hypothetical protein